MDPQRPTPISRYGRALVGQLRVEVRDAARRLPGCGRARSGGSRPRRRRASRRCVRCPAPWSSGRRAGSGSTSSSRSSSPSRDKHQRTHLQKSELRRFARASAAAATANSISTGRPKASSPDLDEVIEHRRQREDIVLEDGSEADDAGCRAGSARRRPRGCRQSTSRPPSSACRRSPPHRDRSGPRAGWQYDPRRLPRNDPGPAPRTPTASSQDVFHRRELHKVPGIARTERQALAAVDDRAPQAQGDCGDSVLEVHGRHGIEVVRAHDAGEIGIETRGHAALPTTCCRMTAIFSSSRR